jgi:hypothetical protein
MVFQKYYWYDYAELFPGIKIFDICDPDWLHGSPNAEVVRMFELMDGIVANTEATAEYVRKITSKPVMVIPDRHDMAKFKERRIHKGRAKSVVWFGYSHNIKPLRMYIPKLQELGLKLTVISDKQVSVSGSQYADFKQFENYVKWPATLDEVNKELIKHDIALLPQSRHPQDQYKSNNKAVHAQAVGLPVAHWGDDLDRLMEESDRTAEADKHYDMVHTEYDCNKSVEQYQSFIEELNAKRNG